MLQTGRTVDVEKSLAAVAETGVRLHLGIEALGSGIATDNDYAGIAASATAVGLQQIVRSDPP